MDNYKLVLNRDRLCERRYSNRSRQLLTAEVMTEGSPGMRITTFITMDLDNNAWLDLFVGKGYLEAIHIGSVLASLPVSSNENLPRL
jgi:hypothetical protein